MHEVVWSYFTWSVFACSVPCFSSQDIVHKFLNRDVEHEQLKSSVKEAEQRLEALREQYERLKKEPQQATIC